GQAMLRDTHHPGGIAGMDHRQASQRVVTQNPHMQGVGLAAKQRDIPRGCPVPRQGMPEFLPERVPERVFLRVPAVHLPVLDRPPSGVQGANDKAHAVQPPAGLPAAMSPRRPDPPPGFLHVLHCSSVWSGTVVAPPAPGGSRAPGSCAFTTESMSGPPRNRRTQSSPKNSRQPRRPSTNLVQVIRIRPVSPVWMARGIGRCRLIPPPHWWESTPVK